MVSYKIDPNQKEPVVETITGSLEYRANCRKYNERWYIVGEDCVNVRNRWYYSDRDILCYDYELKQLTVFSSKMMKGIVEIDEDNLPVLGAFSPNPYYNVSVQTRLGNFTCMDYRILEDTNYIENPATGVWFDAKLISLSDFNRVLTGNAGAGFKDKGYNIEDNAQEYIVKRTLYENFVPTVSKQTRKFAKLIGNITWGNEVEFSKGSLPDYLQNQLGIVMCRDGSTSSGGEAVTVPYQGAKGLQTMKNLGIEATKRMDTDLSCSFHIHIGNLNLSRSYLACLWKLSEKIQDELFKLFPYYKTNPEGVKHKNYNKKLTSLFGVYKKGAIFNNYTDYIDNAYKQIFKFLSEGAMPSYKCNKKQAVHPVREKWNRPSRYYWINFQNALFSNRRTIEFRLHHSTLNSQKMTLWLFICTAIVRYAERHMNDILIQNKDVSLKDVLNYYTEAFPGNYQAKQLSDYLIGYAESRKEEMHKDYSKKDYVGEREAKEDKTYNFIYKGVNNLF